MQQIKKRPFLWGQIAFLAISIPAMILMNNPQHFGKLSSQIHGLDPRTWGERDLRLEPQAQACSLSRQRPSTIADWSCLGTATNFKTNDRTWDVVYRQDALDIFVLHDAVSSESGRYSVQCNAQNVEFLAFLPADSYNSTKSLLEQKFEPASMLATLRTRMGNLPQILKDRLLETCPSQLQPRPQIRPLPPEVSTPSISPAPAPAPAGTIVPIPPATAPK